MVEERHIPISELLCTDILVRRRRHKPVDQTPASLGKQPAKRDVLPEMGSVPHSACQHERLGEECFTGGINGIRLQSQIYMVAFRAVECTFLTFRLMHYALL